MQHPTIGKHDNIFTFQYLACLFVPVLTVNRWYFDAVSASDDSSVVIVFYNSGPAGFINSYEGGPLSVSISGSFANGTLYAATTLATGGAIIDTCPGFINGTWVGSGFSFVGTAVGYEITIDAPEVGISGTIVFKSVSAYSFNPFNVRSSAKHVRIKNCLT